MSNPRPTGVLSHRCPKCGNLSLTALTQCNGGGKFVENWGRWYQICAIPTCKHFVWHNPPTPLDKIPERVLEAFEHKEAAQALGVLKCSQVNCLSTSNTRRKANKLCPNKACASCCRVLGGCQLPQHRPEDALSVEAERLTATSDVPLLTQAPAATKYSTAPPSSYTNGVASKPSSSAPTTQANPTLTQTRTWAQPLRHDYGVIPASQARGSKPCTFENHPPALPYSR